MILIQVALLFLLPLLGLFMVIRYSWKKQNDLAEPAQSHRWPLFLGVFTLLFQAQIVYSLASQEPVYLLVMVPHSIVVGIFSLLVAEVVSRRVKNRILTTTLYITGISFLTVLPIGLFIVLLSHFLK